MQKEDSLEATAPNTAPILSLAMQVLVEPGQEDRPVAIALAEANPKEATELAMEVLSPQDVMTLPLLEIAETVLTQIRPPSDQR